MESQHRNLRYYEEVWGQELGERFLKSNESVNLITQFAVLLSWVKENEK